MNITFEERQLMSLYNTGTRTGLIAALEEMRGYLAADETELRELTDSAIAKLRRMSDAEYDALDLFPDFEKEDMDAEYLDVYLKWYESDRPVTKSFITGKTLGESGADLDRMFLISSAITKAFHGDHGTYARDRKSVV